MEKKYKVRKGAIEKIVPEGSIKWYIMTRWKVEEIGKTNTKKTTNTSSNL